MSVSSFIGIRYSGFGASPGAAENRFLSFISLVSLFGMTLGVIALIVVVSVMNGFDSELKRRILGVVPHLVVSGEVDPALLDDPRIVARAPFIERHGLLLNGSLSQLVTLYGIDVLSESEMSIVPENMTQGSMEDLGDEQHGIVIGRVLAYRLGLVLGDSLTMVIPEPSAGGHRFSPRVSQVRLVGTFELESELDYRLALLNITELQRIVGGPAADTRVRLNNVFDAPALNGALTSGEGSNVRDWTQQYGDFFEAVKMEKIMMFVLLSLIVAIAAFNIISSLSVMVMDKQKDIAVLRTFGLSPFRVMLIFVIQGVVVGAAGILMGSILGLVLAHNITEVVGFFEELSGGKMLAGTYFDSVPTDVRYGDVLVIIMIAFLISVLATLYPAWRAASLKPAEILRYE
ncbi:MAG: lipoprotein-releasing system transmembrane subunit LolC [Gammaproteobacteria bacterium]|nr:lipoprotein-releasing system transmembrane subunit LolC [Gammaproteobacteria bacterium]